MKTRFLTVAEAAEVLGLTRQQVNNLVKARTLRPVKRKVLRRSDVERLAAKRAKQKEREQAAREKRRRLEERIAAVKAEVAAEGGGADGEAGKV